MWQKTKNFFDFKLGIRARLTLFYTSLMAITIILSSFLFYNTLSIRINSTIDHEIEEQIIEYQQAASKVIDKENKLGSFTKQYLAEHTLRPGEIIIVKTLKNQIISSSRLKNIKEIIDNSSQLPVDNVNKIESLTTTRLGKIRIASVPIKLDSETIGLLQISLPLSQTEKTLSDALKITSIISISSLAIVSIFGYFLAASALTPIRRISETVQRITRENLSDRVKHEGPNDEVGDLVVTFNEMIERLDIAFNEQRQFISNASHELRTPLTIAKGNIEVLKRILKSENAEFNEMIDVSLDELDRMNRLINDLLMLARSKQENFLKYEHIDLQKFIKNISLKAKGLVNAKLVVEKAEPLTIHVDKDKLTQAILNLIQNSVNHTDKKDIIKLDTSQEGKMLKINVSDTGKGFDPDETKNIFKRFYRVDEARSKEDGGSGLGLSIVKAIVDAHNGKIEVKSTPGKGSIFTIYLPLNGNTLKE